eukprot:14165612-Ditylum_brightwellii.AAC.1
MLHVIACNVKPKDKDGKLLCKRLTKAINELFSPAQASLRPDDAVSYPACDMALWTTKSLTQHTHAQ